MRVVHLSHDMEAIGRLFSPQHALDAARDRRDGTYDPALADLFLAHGGAWLDRLRETDPWDAVLAAEPEPHRMLAGPELDDALTVVADFIDLKSPYMGGHSRRCADLAADAARVLGLAEEGVTTLSRAALVHDFGTTVVPNSIWDKPGPLTRAEFDRVELHPMLTEQMLRRSPALDLLNTVACAHHEKCDGSGYHKRARADADDLGACVLAATEIYVVLTTERADRQADGRSIRAGSRRARSTCCDSRPRDSPRARSPIGSPSRPRPPIITSSTSTARSTSRHGPPPRSGRCNTRSSSDSRCAQLWCCPAHAIAAKTSAAPQAITIAAICPRSSMRSSVAPAA